MIGIPIGECIVANFWFGKRKAFLLAGSIYAGAVCIAWIVMNATVVCIIFLTAVVIDMETIIALRYRTCSICNAAFTGNGVWGKCIAVLAI